MYLNEKETKDCAVCGENPQISQRMIEDGTINYKTFCGRATFDPIDDKFRVSPKTMIVWFKMKKHILIDVDHANNFKLRIYQMQLTFNGTLHSEKLML